MVKGRRENPMGQHCACFHAKTSTLELGGTFWKAGSHWWWQRSGRKKGCGKCSVKASDTDQQRKKEIQETGSFISRNSLYKSESALYEGEGARMEGSRWLSSNLFGAPQKLDRQRHTGWYKKISWEERSVQLYKTLKTIWWLMPCSCCHVQLKTVTNPSGSRHGVRAPSLSNGTGHPGYSHTLVFVKWEPLHKTFLEVLMQRVGLLCLKTRTLLKCPPKPVQCAERAPTSQTRD